MKDKIINISSLLFAYNEWLFQEGWIDDVDILNEFTEDDIHDFLDLYNIQIDFKTSEH